METIKIAEIKRYDKTSKSTGKPFVSVSIKTEDGRSISGFGNKDNANWAEGDSVEVDIERKGEYLNFTTPRATFSRTPGAPDLNRVEVKLDAIRTDNGLIRGDLADMKGVLGQILQKLGGDDSPF